MKILFDDKRHLITEPYSLENLHLAAKILNIKRCWFHGKEPYAHYDLPKKLANTTPTLLMLRACDHQLTLEDEGEDLMAMPEISIHKVSSRRILEVIHEARLRSMR